MTEKALPPDAAARGPQDEAGPKIGAPPSAAAGLPAVIATLRHAWDEMGAARGLQALLRVNQKDGFDCQSCAWPNPDDDRHTAEFCENGAKAVADEVTTRRVEPSFFEQWSVESLAARTDHWLNDQGRITHPMVLEKGASHYRPISWDEAFSRIGTTLRDLSSADEAAFYTSGRTSNEAAFLYQLFVRSYGTNNLPDCSNMCHESSGAALNESIGVGKGTVTLDDFSRTDLILIIGQNPGTNHPRMLTTLQDAVRKGVKIITINPLREVGTVAFRNPQEARGLAGFPTALSSMHIPVRIHGDLALLKGVMKTLLDRHDAGEKVFDVGFITSRTSGFEALAEDLRATQWERITESSGIDRTTITLLADEVARAGKIICTWAMGLTQHPAAVATIQQIVNLLLLKGSIGKPGAGACPVRGHSNVQGDRTMGIWEKPKPALLDAIEREFGFAPPRRHGLDSVDTIRGMYEGRVRVFFALGGNFLSATPDTDYTAAALRRCRMTVHVSTKLNRSHLVHGEEAMILPCLGRSEADLQNGMPQFVTVEDSMGVISPSRGEFPPASPDLLSEVMIVARLAEATVADRSPVPWTALASDYDLIRERIARVIPGFDDFNERIGKGPFHLHNAAREGEFRVEGERARFTVAPIPDELLASDDELIMMTIRSHDQFNTTVYGLDDRYRGIHGGRRVILMNPADIQSRGLSAGTLVDIHSSRDGRSRIAPAFRVVPYEIPARCVATYFPEANVLVPVGHVAAVSNTPASKSVVVTVTPAASGNA